MTRLFFVLCFALLFGFNTVSAQNYSTHKVKEGETVESIAKRYYVTPFDIYSLNPDSKKELKVNAVLIIPKSKIQEPKITIVKELQGFKAHKTRRKETLYSLSKKYNVSEEDIKKHNTFLYANSLRKGDRLQIPQFKITEIEEAVELTKTYAVLPKEGKWRVAYKFNITLAELEALNPEMGDILQEGEVLNVPNIEDTEEKEVDETYSYYKVRKAQGFYSLKRELGLEQEELEALNPGLSESGLKNGMILKIPFDNSIAGILDEDSNRINLTDSISDFNTKRIAVMLPFRLNRVDFDSVQGTKRSIKRDRYLNASLDFHSGVLLAIDSLKRLGVSLNVDVYDTKGQVSTVSQIIEDNDFENVDAVIGPLTSATFEKAAAKLRRYHVPIISPTGTKLKLYDNVFQSKPSNELLRNKVVDFVKNDTLSTNVIIIADSKNKDVANELKSEFGYARLVYSRKNKNKKDDSEVDAFYVKKDDIKDVLKTGQNMVFLETQDEGFVSNVTSILASLIQEENVEERLEEVSIILTTTKINSAFEGNEVDNSHLSDLQFTFASASKAYKENNPFVERYEGLYRNTPNGAAVKGFDLTMDIVLRLVSSEDLYMSVKDAPLTEYVENKFAYKRKSFGGYYNDTVYLVRHQDLEILELKQ